MCDIDLVVLTPLQAFLGKFINRGLPVGPTALSQISYNAKFLE